MTALVLPRINVSSDYIDSTTNAIKTIDYEHKEIHSGSHYFVKGFISIPALNDVLDMTFQMPDTARWLHWTWEIWYSKDLTWYIYEDAVATNALANTATIFNSNRNSSNTSGAVLKYEVQDDLEAANDDTAVGSATLLETGRQGDNRTSGDSRRSNELILKQGSMYCLRAVASAATVLDFRMDWYEHVNR